MLFCVFNLSINYKCYLIQIMILIGETAFCFTWTLVTEVLLVCIKTIQTPSLFVHSRVKTAKVLVATGYYMTSYRRAFLLTLLCLSRLVCCAAREARDGLLVRAALLAPSRRRRLALPDRRHCRPAQGLLHGSLF